MKRMPSSSFNDLTGYGRCSSQWRSQIDEMGVCCCPAPTQILSNHTGFERFFKLIYRHLQGYIDGWRKRISDLTVYTGFGSERQTTTWSHI
ncbi:MAG: hypothetical protein ACLTXL_06240 [Clostridia bacterium]